MMMNKYNEYDDILLPFGNKIFYIDLDSILDAVLFDTMDIPTSEELVGKSKNKNKKKNEINELEIPDNFGITINVTKWEVINKLMDVLLNEISDHDDKLGMKNLEKFSIGFKIAFNTLLKNNIIKIMDNE